MKPEWFPHIMHGVGSVCGKTGGHGGGLEKHVRTPVVNEQNHECRNAGLQWPKCLERSAIFCDQRQKTKLAELSKK